jgi:hypothetical protein
VLTADSQASALLDFYTIFSFLSTSTSDYSKVLYLKVFWLPNTYLNTYLYIYLITYLKTYLTSPQSRTESELYDAEESGGDHLSLLP